VRRVTYAKASRHAALTSLCLLSAHLTVRAAAEMKCIPTDASAAAAAGEPCSPGSYSLDPANFTCDACPLHGSCPGGAALLVSVFNNIACQASCFTSTVRSNRCHAQIARAHAARPSAACFTNCQESPVRNCFLLCCTHCAALRAAAAGGLLALLKPVTTDTRVSRAGVSAPEQKCIVRAATC
jgi:hypothetical protein